MAAWFEADEVPQGWRDALVASLGGVYERDPALGDRVLAQVLTGSDPAVPPDLRTYVASRFTDHFFRYAGEPGVLGARELLRTLGTVPPAVALRFARLVEGSTWPHHLGLRSVAGGRWCEALVLLAAAAFGHTRHASAPVDLDLGVLEALVAYAGGDPRDVTAIAFEEADARYSYLNHGYDHTLPAMPGYDDAVRRHVGHLRETVLAAGVDGRLQAVPLLAALSDETLALFAAQVVDYATSSSSKVRAAAAPLLPRIVEASLAPLRAVAGTGKPEARTLALRALHGTGLADQQTWAVERAGEDRAASVNALLDEWAATPLGNDELVVDVPVLEWAVEMTPHLRAALEALLRDLDAKIAARNEQTEANHRQAAAAGRPYQDAPVLVPPFDEERIASVVSALECGEVPDLGATFANRAWLLTEELARHLPALVAAGLGPTQLVLLMTADAELMQPRWDGGLSHFSRRLVERMHALAGAPGLLELASLLDARGLPGTRMTARSVLSAYDGALGRHWPDEDVAPFVAANLDTFLDIVERPAARESWLDPLAAYTALSTLPTKPHRVVTALYAAALGPRTTERRAAQDALEGVPGVVDRVVGSLTDGKADVRIAAARWLQRLGHTDAVPALEKAVDAERQDAALGVLIDVLESLGQPVEKYVDRDALDAKAAKAMQKGVSKDLAWFPFDRLPPLRWAATGEPVAATTVRWLLNQAVRAKSPEPDALLRKYADLFDPGDRVAFGQFVLEAWVAQDLTPIDLGLAEARARGQAAWYAQMMARRPQDFANDPMLGRSEAELAAAFLPRISRTPVGSATTSKGLLAVVGACGGEGVAPVAQRYLKDWYGQRASQGKALIGMLAWVEHPSATQLMLSVGSRFRTKTFQDEATRQAAALAERRGWTLAELADRTIPTAGLDAHGVLELPYGDRTFTGHLTPRLTLTLRSPEGKEISSLPAPRKSDDEDAVKASKKALSAARKELKSVVELQSGRLYEALCTGRTWTFEDWHRYLDRHPVIRHLTQRLAWVATVGDERIVFRPLGDGTLTDADDEPVTLPDDAVVAVAHDSLLTPEQVAAWQAHFTDYEVVPLFQQLGKGSYTLPEDQEDEYALTDFVGHRLEAFTLRGQATKLGYARGAAGDGGYFYDYEKRYPTLGLTAVAGFSGNCLPEENNPVALGELTFVRSGPDGNRSTVRLGDVPRVLLSEAWNDVRVIAATGTGFDPEWQQKVLV